MKCDTCRNMVGEGPSMDYPYPMVYCAKGYWEGIGIEVDGADPWTNCPDYEAMSEWSDE